MSLESFCFNCYLNECCDKDIICNGVKAVHKICAEQDTNEKRDLIRQYAKELDIIECEVSDELRQLGEKVICGMPELQYINDYGIKVGYVLSYEAKRKDGKCIAGYCRKVTGSYKAYLPFDFIITFYEPNISYMTENQRKVLMLHELKHIGIGQRGLKIEPHDIEDFASILTRYGIRWGEFDNDIPDILAGGDNEENNEAKKENRKKTANKSAGRK